MLKSKVLAAVLAACVAGLPVLHGYADELSEKQAEYDRVQQQMRDMEAQREEARRAADAAGDGRLGHARLADQRFESAINKQNRHLAFVQNRESNKNATYLP